MKEMRDEYKDSFIYKVCKELEIHMKELAIIMNKNLKCIEVWRRDDENIPAKEIQYMKLLIKNKKLEDEVIRLQKHRVVLYDLLKSDINGEAIIQCKSVNGLKKLINYRIVLEEF